MKLKIWTKSKTKVKFTENKYWKIQSWHREPTYLLSRAYIHHLSDVDDNMGPEATAEDGEAEQEGKADAKDSEIVKWHDMKVRGNL